MVAVNGDSRAVGFLLLLEDLADNGVVGDIFTSVGRDVIIVDNEEVVYPFDALSYSLCIPSYILA